MAQLSQNARRGGTERDRERQARACEQGVCTEVHVDLCRLPFASFAAKRRCRSSGTIPSRMDSGRRAVVPNSSAAAVATDVDAGRIEDSRCDLPEERFGALVALQHGSGIIDAMTT